MALVKRELADGTIVEEEDIAGPPEEYLAERHRQTRNALIAETDHWALADRTMTQAQIDYRQALRDITSQAGFPQTVNWPTKPE